MTIKPQTTSNEILADLDAILEKGVMLNSSSPEALALFASIDKLEHADPDESLNLRALVLHLCNDLDSAITVLEQREHKDLLRNMVLLSNYSRCSAAQEIFASYCSPKSGNFWRCIPFAYPIGAFRQVAEFAREAERMQLQSKSAISLEGIYMIDEVLDDLGITDANAGRVMELAGRVLSEHGFMFLGPGPEVEIVNDGGERRAVHLTYRIAASATDAVSIYMKFIEQLFYREIDMPDGFHVSFGGATS
ncbi:MULTISPECIES: hypothetical protein [unclassified Janthinobacterium]|uniref:hypothetical protein n=1 Tax=unclassified Janthinobacterium TaxID=2610881 RepID=UPI0018CACCED|nr:hypothetical protein [Janthinobacterium sp. CG_23.4]MDH6156673.1 hypothetical protein [Janthinobacterium sp. CG_23.4]